MNKRYSTPEQALDSRMTSSYSIRNKLRGIIPCVLSLARKSSSKLEISLTPFENKTIKSLLIISFVIGLFSLLAINPNAAFAQTTEAQRNNELEQQLLLSLPTTTENPNFIVTFTDPSGKGVWISIDGKDAVKIANPYTLPTLGIGKHTLTFKFNDKQQTPQSLDRDLVIIPRAPQIKSPDTTGGILTLNGTGLAGSTIEILISDNSKTQTVETSVDTSGNWTYASEKPLETGKYTIIAIARKYGYASKYSEATIFNIGDPTSNVTNTGTILPDQTTGKNIYFNFASITADNLVSSIENNKDLLFFAGAFALLGMLIGMLFGRIFRNKETRKAEDLLRTVFQKNDTETKSEKKTDSKPRFSLIEKLERSKVSDKIEKEEEEKQVTLSTDSIIPEGKKSKGKKSENKNEKITMEETKVIVETEKSSEVVNDEAKIKVETPNETPQTEKIIEEITAEKVDEIKEEVKQDETPGSVISKEDFLMKFKDFDPDKNSKAKKNIKISLTSKKE